ATEVMRVEVPVPHRDAIIHSAVVAREPATVRPTRVTAGDQAVVATAVVPRGRPMPPAEAPGGVFPTRRTTQMRVGITVARDGGLSPFLRVVGEPGVPRLDL